MENQAEHYPSEQNIEDYKLLGNMLDSLLIQIAILSKKSPDGIMNLTKVKMINRILKPMKEEIFHNEPSSAFLDLLDEEQIPSNSDAVLVISQYKTAIKEFEKSYCNSYGSWITLEGIQASLQAEEDWNEEDEGET